MYLNEQRVSIYKKCWGKQLQLARIDRCILLTWKYATYFDANIYAVLFRSFEIERMVSIQGLPKTPFFNEWQPLKIYAVALIEETYFLYYRKNNCVSIIFTFVFLHKHFPFIALLERITHRTTSGKGSSQSQDSHVTWSHFHVHVYEWFHSFCTLLRPGTSNLCNFLIQSNAI